MRPERRKSLQPVSMFMIAVSSRQGEEEERDKMEREVGKGHAGAGLFRTGFSQITISN